jgi:peptidoglycan/LPS O-acetylase OafA/YrhL
LSHKRRYSTLDGLRGIGALFVVLLHFAPSYGSPEPVHAYLAVDMFFCLSGFVLTRGYAGRLVGGISFTEWMGIRLRRLYPLFFLSIILGFVGANLLPDFPGSNLSPSGRGIALASGILMLPSPTWPVKAMFPLNFAAWSLFIEMMLSVKFYWSSKISDRFVWALLGLGLAGLLLVRIKVGYIGGGYSWRDMPIGMIRGLFSFSAGMLIARKTNGAHIVSHWAWVPIIVGAAMMAYIPQKHAVAYDLAAIILGFPLLILVAVHLEPVKPDLFRVAGALSYPCYALHWATFFAIQCLFGFGPSHPAPIIAGAAVFAAFLYGCRLLDRYYDTPLRMRGIKALERAGRSRSEVVAAEQADISSHEAGRSVGWRERSNPPRPVS